MKISLKNAKKIADANYLKWGLKNPHNKKIQVYYVKGMFGKLYLNKEIPNQGELSTPN